MILLKEQKKNKQHISFNLRHCFEAQISKKIKTDIVPYTKYSARVLGLYIGQDLEFQLVNAKEIKLLIVLFSIEYKTSRRKFKNSTNLELTCFPQCVLTSARKPQSPIDSKTYTRGRVANVLRRAHSHALCHIISSLPFRSRKRILFKVNCVLVNITLTCARDILELHSNWL